jgi:predicted RNA-binding protein with PUA-like domain
MNYWLAKTEPDEFSIDDLKRDKKTAWSGVRNYQARNFLDAMVPGDLVLVYHSSADVIGVAGVGKVVGTAYADPLQFSKKSDYFDARSKRESPIWITRDVGFVKKLKRIVTLDEIRQDKALKNMRLLQIGNRLSVMPVSEEEYERILEMSQ